MPRCEALQRYHLVMARRRSALIAGFLGAVLVALAGRSFRRLAIAERSMEPALADGDFVIARRLRRTPRRGDIVTFPSPTSEDVLLVKRVVGLPGELIAAHNGQVHVDGRVLAERWADGPTLPDGEWAISSDEVFVLSDNRAVTLADSRAFGAVPLSSLGHRIAFRYWPGSAVGLVR